MFTDFLFQVSEGRCNLPQGIQLTMKLFLEEMMSSLGWALPSYDVTNPSPGVYVCLTREIQTITPAKALRGTNSTINYVQ